MKTLHENAPKLNRPSYQRSPLVRVSHRNRCKVCGHPDWCSSTEDGQLGFCMRTAAGSFKQATNGAYLHRLTDSSPPTPTFKKPKRTSVQAVPLASIEYRDAVYEALVYSYLVLSREHEAKLRARGFDPITIRVNGYASTPPPAYAANVARALTAQYNLEGVPGFYRECGQWRMVRMDQGILIPVRDIHGRIQGLMIRRDDATGSGKYIWLSSRDRDGGASSGAPAHYAKAYKLRGASEVVITEGALKADVIAYLTGSPAIGIAGVSSFGPDFAAHLRESCPNLSRVLIAYDRDLLEKPEVYGALMRLTAQLERASFQVRIRTWPPPSKGLDDYLLSQLIQQGVQAA